MIAGNATSIGARKSTTGSVDHAEDQSRHRIVVHRQSLYEEELNRIRTEGDLALIKVQAERKKLAETEAQLRVLTKTLKDKKKDSKKNSTRGPVATDSSALDRPRGKSRQTSLMFFRSNDIRSGVKTHTDTAQTSKALMTGPSGATACKAAPNERLMHLEERLKVTVSERTTELHKLRHTIDETRRERLEALASEQIILKATREAEEDIAHSQSETERLRRQSADLKSEIAQMEQAFDAEKQAFRLEQQRLLEEVEETGKADKGSLPEQTALATHKQSMYYNIGHRKKYERRMSKSKRASLDQKLVSFEQKKWLLDRIVEETNAGNMSDFIHKYNAQECTKNDIFARIETQAATNLTLSDSIAHLAADISRLSGADESDNDSRLENPTELQTTIDVSEMHIKRWNQDAHVYSEAVKAFHKPIADLYLEFFPGDLDEDPLDSASTSDQRMMRQIGAIEERAMQLIMAKILEETESAMTPNSSETLRRLRQYQGKRDSRDSSTSAQNKTGGVVPPSSLKEEQPRRSKEGRICDDDNDDDGDPSKEVAIVHSDVCRQSITGIVAAGDHSDGSSHHGVQAAPATKNTTAGAGAVTPRKNATVAL